MTEDVQIVARCRTLLADNLALDEPRNVMEWGYFLDALDELDRDVSLLRSQAIQSIAENMEEDRLTIPGLGTLVRSEDKRRKNWEGRRLAFALTAAVLDKTDGEAMPEDIVDEIVRCSGIDNPSHSWRVGELKTRGINPNLYSEFGESRALRVRIEKAVA